MRAAIYISVKLIVISGVFLLLSLPDVYAQEHSQPSESPQFRNPFVSPFPKIKIEIPEPTIAVITETSVEITPPSLTINGLIWNTDNPQAIVNDQVVGVGDTIAEVTILGIQRSGIQILYSGKTFSIAMNTESTKQLNTPFNFNP